MLNWTAESYQKWQEENMPIPSPEELSKIAVEWTDEQWIEWQKENDRLLSEGWSRLELYGVDGTDKWLSWKEGAWIDRTPEPMKRPYRWDKNGKRIDC